MAKQKQKLQQKKVNNNNNNKKHVSWVEFPEAFEVGTGMRARAHAQNQTDKRELISSRKTSRERSNYRPKSPAVADVACAIKYKGCQLLSLKTLLASKDSVKRRCVWQSSHHVLHIY